VDFINNSVADLLEKEFGRSLSDENVHVLEISLSVLIKKISAPQTVKAA